MLPKLKVFSTDRSRRSANIIQIIGHQLTTEDDDIRRISILIIADILPTYLPLYITESSLLSRMKFIPVLRAFILLLNPIPQISGAIRSNMIRRISDLLRGNLVFAISIIKGTSHPVPTKAININSFKVFALGMLTESLWSVNLVSAIIISMLPIRFGGLCISSERTVPAIRLLANHKTAVIG